MPRPHGMELILHIGMTKTGSTAIQYALTRAYKDALRAGVLYPRALANAVNHNFLALAQRDMANLPRVFAHLYKGREDLMQRDLARNWAHVTQQIEQYEPRTLVLSSESLFKGFSLGDGAAFRDQLYRLTPEVTVVAYVRRPASHYLSAIQQKVKSQAQVQPPRPLAFRESLEACEALFGRARLKVLKYEPDALIDGDVVTDFVTRFLPNLGASLAGRDDQRINQSLSAESMEILQDYWLAHPELTGHAAWFHGKQRLLALRRIEQGHGLTAKSVLKPEVGRDVDQASVDLLWLRDHHGIEFKDVDYGRVGNGESLGGDCWRISDLCQVDPERKRAIQALLAREPEVRVPLGSNLYSWLRRHSGSPLLRWLRHVSGFNRGGV